MDGAQTTPHPGRSPESPRRRGFWSLFASQFQEAFSDLAFRNLVIFVFLGIGLAQAERDRLVPAVGALFALPFVLFSMLGGYLADRFSKRSVAIALKAVEVGSMTLGLIGLATRNIPLLLAVVFLISAQSAFYGPSKWGLLPELLPEKKLSWGNGVIQMGTYLAGILGTIAAAAMSERFRGDQAWSGGILIGLAAAGLLVTFGISRVPAANPARSLRLNFFAELGAQWRRIRADRVLLLAVLGNAYFLFLASLLQPNIILYGKDILRVPDTQNGFLQAAVALGIGLGSLAAGYLSGNKIEYGLVPLGSAGMVVCAAALSRSGLAFQDVAALLALLGFSGGFFIVPLSAMIQHRPEEKFRGGVIAAANLLSWTGALAAAGVFYLLVSVAGLAPPAVFLAGAAATLAATVYVTRLAPDSLLRLLLWMLTHTFYRVRIEGRDNIPEKGGALLVTDHLSIAGALFLMASTDRSVRFLVAGAYYEHPWIGPFARMLGAIPLPGESRPREMIHALRQAGAAIREGHVVCLLAGGQMSRVGRLRPFRKGFARILRGCEAPLLPVHLDGVPDDVLHLQGGRISWKMPRRLRQPVTVSFGTPLPPEGTPFEVRQAVQDLHTAAYCHRRGALLPLHRALIRTARRRPFRFAMGDSRVPRLNWGTALARTVFLSRRLRKIWEGQTMVGILLPPSVGGALVNFSAQLTGRVPVNLNYTASNEILADCARQCGIETVVTSRAFLERVKLEVPGRAVILEDLVARPRLSEKLLALLLAWALPARLLEKTLGRSRAASLDDLATVIFSSGSTGDPKGVLLTHYNVGANIEQISQVFALSREDRLLGILPFFHSTGFTAGLWFPAVAGAGIAYYPNPLDPRAVGTSVRDYSVTVLVATPTFLQLYVRRCAPEDFRSLRLVLTGAEKLPRRLAEAFEEAFGIPPHEAYGCTECAPVVTASAPDSHAAGVFRMRPKPGKVGLPLPGVSIRIVDPETLAPLPPGTEGLLLVRGPNVMQGYLGCPEKTAEVLRDGWYVTGDIATVDEDGFVEITDRLSRFSKVGGEMVPHLRVEEVLHELAGRAEQTFVVTGIPDGAKGERLVVLHTLPAEDLEDCLEKLPRAGLPPLWVPRPNQFFQVEALPCLGTGKLDLRKVREMAARLSEGSRQGIAQGRN